MWSTLSAAFVQVSTLVVAVVIARVLGASDFGALAIVNSTMGLLGVFAGLGLGLTATKYVAELKAVAPSRVGAILDLLDRVVVASGAIMAAALFGLAPWLATDVLAAPHLVDELRIGCLLLIFNEINGVQVGALAGFEAFRVIAAINLVRGVAAIPLSIVGAVAFGVTGAVLALVGTSLIALVLSARAIREERRRAGIASAGQTSLLGELPILWRFALPAFLASALVGPVMWLGNAWLATSRDGYVELGVFSAANQWRTSVLFLPTVLGQAALPILASLIGLNRGRSVRRVLGGTMAACAATALPVAAVLILGRDVIMGMYGEGFAGRGDVLAIVAVTVIIMAFQLPIGQLLAASGRMWLGLAINTVWASVFVVAAQRLIGGGRGADGLALAFLVSYGVHSISTIAVGVWLLRGQSRRGMGSGPG